MRQGRGGGEGEEEDDPAPARSEEREQVPVRVGALLGAEAVLALRDGAQDARQRLDRRRRVPLVVAHVARVVRQRDDRRLRTSQETSSQSQRSLQRAETRPGLRRSWRATRWSAGGGSRSSAGGRGSALARPGAQGRAGEDAQSRCSWRRVRGGGRAAAERGWRR